MTAQLKFESAQQIQAFEELTNGGDNIVFGASFAPISNKAGFRPVVAPYGLLTGGVVTPNTGTDDSVSVAAQTVLAPGMTGANSAGVVSVSGGNVSVSRGVTTDTHRITSITVDSSGSLAAVAGIDNAGSFSEVRGADGGPPLIPVGSIEIAQVRLSSVTAGDVVTGEIFQVPGTHLERSDFPIVSSINYATGEVNFAEALPNIHTGTVPKKVYLKGYTPLLAPLSFVSDWVPAESSYSTSSVDTYDGPVGSAQSSLGQASFTFQSDDGMSDAILALVGEEIWFEYRPDRNALLPKQLTLGILGVSRTNPVSGKKPISATISASQRTVDVLS